MKAGYTHVSMLVDRSFSMNAIKEDTVGGINTFISQQRATPGKMTFTLCQFDDHYDIIHCFKDIQQVPMLTKETFVPRGSTALLDSIGKLIVDTGNRLASLSEDERPEKVIICIVTDGEENASTEYNNEKVAAMIKHQTEAYNWHFTYIGANQDSFSVAKKMNIQSGLNYRADSLGTRAAFSAFASNTSMNRGTTGTDYLATTQKDIDLAEQQNP